MASSALAYAVKDVLLDRYYPSVYDSAAKQPIVPGKVVFYEQKLTQMPDAYDQLWKRINDDPRFQAVYVTARQNDSSKPEFIRNCARALREIATADIVILNDASNIISCVSLRPETTAIQLWHACGAFKKWGMSTADLQFGENRAQQLRHPYYENLSLVTTSSPEVNWAYAEAMNLQGRDQIIQALGVSRTDIFFDPDFLQRARRTIQQAIPQAAGKEIILYAPTFRGKVSKAAAPDQLNIAAMAKALGRDHVLLIKQHPFVKNRPAIPPTAQDFAFDVSDAMPIDVLLAAADLCITDYSSVVFEYSLFDRPIMFFAYDKAEYDDWRGFYYDYDQLTPGPVLQTTQQVIACIRQADKEFDPAQVREFRQKFMSACDGHATDRVMRFIEDHAHVDKRGEGEAVQVAEGAIAEGNPSGAVATALVPSTSNPTYQLSVIVPVYNGARALPRTLDSLLAQNLGAGRRRASDDNAQAQSPDQLQIVIVNDGSTDASLQVARDYEAKHPNIKVVNQPNRGVSAARNAGIDAADGAYLAFVDAGDTLLPDTLGLAVQLLQQHAADIDLVCYPMRIIQEGRKKPHVREQILTHTGVYNLDKLANAFALITNVNVVVKNIPSLPRFDEGLQVHEDEVFNMQVLLPKQAVGFSDQGAYVYNQTDTSAINTKMHPKHQFEQNIGFWERLFALYPEGEPVPLYLQASYVNELNWKIKQDLLFPRHYRGKKQAKARARQIALLDRVDDDVIWLEPRADEFLKHYFYALKTNTRTRFGLNDQGMLLWDGDRLLLCRQHVLVQVHPRRVRKGSQPITGMVKTVAAQYADSFACTMITPDGERRTLKLEPAPEASELGGEPIANFLQFEAEVNPKDLDKLQFEITIEGITLPGKVEIVRKRPLWWRAARAAKRRAQKTAYKIKTR